MHSRFSGVQGIANMIVSVFNYEFVRCWTVNVFNHKFVCCWTTFRCDFCCKTFLKMCETDKNIAFVAQQNLNALMLKMWWKSVNARGCKTSYVQKYGHATHHLATQLTIHYTKCGSHNQYGQFGWFNKCIMCSAYHAT